MKPARLVCLLAVASGTSYALSGQLTSADCSAIQGSINGWSGVDIYDGTVYLATANDTSGYFYLATPGSLKDDQVHLINAYFSGGVSPLQYSPFPLQCPAGSSGYQYAVTDAFSEETSVNSSYWQANGTISFSRPNGIWGGGSLIAKTGLAGVSTTDQEVLLTLDLSSNVSGLVNYIYLFASQNAPNSGSYLAVGLSGQQCSSTGECTASLVVSLGTSTLLSTPVGFQSPVEIRAAAATPTSTTSLYRGQTVVNVMVNGGVYTVPAGTSLSSGMPGVGTYSGSLNYVMEAQIGPADSTQPAAVTTTTVNTDIYFNSVTAQWQGATDSNGSGTVYYYVNRSAGSYNDPNLWSSWSSDATLYDSTVQPQNNYTYYITPYDFHGNAGPTAQFLASVPPQYAIDPRRIGVEPNGSYWGGAGEQIDVLSANLGFSMPLLTAMGRAGLQATFGLSYNSQNWRGVGSIWRDLGADVGYGFGWQLMLGSLVPVYGGDAKIAYYLYTDSTGAQYRLDQPNSARTVWGSLSSIYLWYDSSADLLHFRDGKFWVMGCTSAPNEQDAGTLYPTIVEDSNGNQIIITYTQGSGAYSYNSSARILTIEDVRAQSCSHNTIAGLCSYEFQWNTTNHNQGGTPYALEQIFSDVGTPESYTFTITPDLYLSNPGGGGSGLNLGMLQSVMQSVTATTPSGSTPTSYSWTFQYEQPASCSGCTALGDGSLTWVQFPHGGYLGWTYDLFTYSGNRAMEEVNKRFLQPMAGGSLSTTPCIAPNPLCYPVTTTDPNGGSNAIAVHSNRTIQDPTNTQKIWNFQNNYQLDSSDIGLVTQFEEFASGATYPMRELQYYWSTDLAGNPYVSILSTTLDVNQPYQASTLTEQALDQYGNVTTMYVQDYGATGFTRTYNNTYSSSYAQYYMYNRLLTSNVTSGSTTISLASNVYDGTSLTSPAGPLPEHDNANYNSSFTARGNLTQASTPGRTINMHYDTTGTMVSEDDNNGNSLAMTTTSNTNYTLPETLTPNGDSNLASQASYNPASYALTSMASPMQSPVDPEGNCNSCTAPYYTYDTYGRVSTAVAPAQSTSQAGATTNYYYSYGSSGWTVSTVTAGNNWTTTTQDGFGRSIEVQTGTGSSPGNQATVVSEVDTTYSPCACSPMGKKSAQVGPFLPGDTGPSVTYTFDALGRTLTAAAADGSVTQYQYRGNFTNVIDAAGNWKQFASDAFGNLTAVIEPDPNATPLVTTPPSPPTYPVTSPPTRTLLTSYNYDLVNHLATIGSIRAVTMPRGANTQTRDFSYPATAYTNAVLPALWLASTTNPENGTINYTYYNDGTLSSKQYGSSGNKETYYYDGNQRLQYIHRFPNGGSEDTNQLQTFGYDANGYYGMLTSVIFGTNVGLSQLQMTNQYAYTLAGAVSTKTLSLASANHDNASGSVSVNYTYDNQGVLNTMAPTGAPTLTYSLDAMERQSGLTDSSNTTWASGAAYNAANQITGGTLNGLTWTWYYNNLSQVTTETAKLGSQVEVNMDYYYHGGANNGQMYKSVNYALPTAETITYTYDLLKRLTAASSSAGWSESYTTDPFANLTGMTGSGGAPNLSVTASYQTNRISPTGITYDNYGNVTYLPALSMSLGYDVANRMVSAGSNTYAYDQGNRRVYHYDGSNPETIYLYGSGGKKLATYFIAVSDTAITFTLKSENVYFAGKLISAEGNPVAPDRLGSVRWSDIGSTKHSYYPYGVEYSASTNDTEKYATYTRDNVTGLDYAKNRYYSSIWGRFTSPDPSWSSANPANPQSWNRYGYVGGDPMNHNDPTGLYLSAEECIADADACVDEDEEGAPDPPAANGCAGDSLPVASFGELEDASQSPDACPPRRVLPSPSQYWEVDVGYTQVAPPHFDHLFVWAHVVGATPTEPLWAGDSEVFDGGSSIPCPWTRAPFGCGSVAAWTSVYGHYKELLSPSFQIFWEEPLGSNPMALQRLNAVFSGIQEYLDIGGPTYRPTTGPNSNSVAYTFLQASGLLTGQLFPIQPTTAFGAPAGQLYWNGALQKFTGWGQSLGVF